MILCYTVCTEIACLKPCTKENTRWRGHELGQTNSELLNISKTSHSNSAFISARWYAIPAVLACTTSQVARSRSCRSCLPKRPHTTSGCPKSASCLSAMKYCDEAVALSH